VIKIASIGFTVVTLAMSALPAHADSETIGLLIGSSGAPHGARSSPQQSHDMSRLQTRLSYAEAPGLPRNACGHVGGPKGGNWSCR
jgi:hypothetical protein